MTTADDANDPEQRRADRHRRVALASLLALALALVLCTTAVWLFFWAIGRGLSTPGGVADRESEMLALGAILAGITALAALVGAVGMASTGWPLPKPFWTGLLLAFLVVSTWLVVVPMTRL